MLIVALKMLARDRAKFLSIVMGVTFAVFLIVEQGCVFTGLMRRSGAIILDTKSVDLWVFDSRVKTVDDLRALKDSDLWRVRDVEGVEWATRWFKGAARAKRLDGRYENVLVIGVDDATMIGAPSAMVEGSVADLVRRDAGIIDVAGSMKIGGVEVGEELTFNDRRAVIVGKSAATRNFQSLPVIHTRYSQAIQWVPTERSTLSAILVKVEPGVDADVVAARIRDTTGLIAETPEEFRWRTIRYVLKYTGIAINIGTTIALGFIVGAAIAGQTFYSFAVDNLKQFAALKAMGASEGTLAAMILVQACAVAALGYGIGVGMASIVARSAGPNGQLPAYLTPELLLISAGAVFSLCMGAGLVALRKVAKTEPAMVFK